MREVVDADGQQTSTTPRLIPDRNAFHASTAALYVQDEWRITGRLTLNFGLRWDQMVQYVTAGQVSPRLNLVWRATDSTVVHAGYARTFTPPQFELVTTPALAAFENTTNAPFSLTNGLPRPERANRFDIGVSQRLFGNLTLGIDAYYKDVQDLLSDVQQTFANAMIYNRVGTEVFNLAKKLRMLFNEKSRKPRFELSAKLEELRAQRETRAAPLPAPSSSSTAAMPVRSVAVFQDAAEMTEPMSGVERAGETTETGFASVRNLSISIP